MNKHSRSDDHVALPFQLEYFHSAQNAGHRLSLAEADDHFGLLVWPEEFFGEGEKRPISLFVVDAQLGLRAQSVRSHTLL